MFRNGGVDLKAISMRRGRLRKVVDTNYLKSAELKEYLAKQGNHIVIPDLVLMRLIWTDFRAKIKKRKRFTKQHATCLSTSIKKSERSPVTNRFQAIPSHRSARLRVR